MKKFLVAFVVFLIWSFFGIWIYSLLQDNDITRDSTSKIAENKNHGDTSNELIDNSTIEPDSINTEDTLEITIPEKDLGLKALNHLGEVIFIFEEGTSTKINSAVVDIPLSTIDYKNKLKSYHLKHPNQVLFIHSIYSPTENLETPNFGIQRGTLIKEQLVEFGISENIIFVKSIIKDITFEKDGSTYNNISFAFNTVSEEEKKTDVSKIPKNTIVYPKYSGTAILINDALRNLLNEIVTFSKDNPNLKIEIIGHTDNIGSALDNYSTGMSYAKQVRWYLIAKGNLDKSMIKAFSKGETEPIADNNTLSGRTINRRIEVIFN